jgi:hypothetical protein
MVELVELIAAESDPTERARMVNTVKEVAALYTSPDEIKKRAEAIIDDAERYDAETRAAISQLLKEESEDLGVMVARVENGETVLDLTRHDGQADALTRARQSQAAWMNTTKDYPTITIDEARELAETFLNFEWKENQLFALTKLLRGIVGAHYAERHADKEGTVSRTPSPESYVNEIELLIYAYTFHHNRAQHEFAMLDPTNPRDLLVINDEIGNGGARGSE